MGIQHKSSGSVVIIGALFSILGVTSALSADSVVTAPSKELRQRMAQAHEKMAVCLRSERDFSECRQEMMQACSGQPATMGCAAMMGQGMMMRNQMRSGAKQQSSASASK